MEMIGAIENMNLTLQIPDDSISAEIARAGRPTMRTRYPVLTLYLSKPLSG
jgi:hypothetical protein